MEITYDFVDYGEVLTARPGTLVLDVGMRTEPGIIDHHHPDAEPECAASLVVKHPRLVVDHLRPAGAALPDRCQIITHRNPDFDAAAAAFLALRLLTTGNVDEAMFDLAAYARSVDSASLPAEVDLASTPYAILRALFARLKGEDETAVGRARLEEGQKFMAFVHARRAEGYEILANRALFRGVDRFERAMRRAEEDYWSYLDDLARARKMRLWLPFSSAPGRREVDGLAVRNPRSFLLKEWARRDRDNASLGCGFSFVLTDFGGRRFILGVDPAAGVNLKGLGALLNEREAAKRRDLGRQEPVRWYEGNCPLFDYRIIDSPRDGPALTSGDVVEAVLAFGRG
ncbi:MAG: hypothetical protein OEW05_13620 [Candidatus Aminicenantes bacterium]|nr:hypothetical protein [Candidatus Aminicenantes bacterium]